MLQQAIDLREEGDALDALLAELQPADWARPTPFKGWSVDDVVAHLHSGDRAAVLSLEDGARFRAMVAERQQRGAAGGAARARPADEFDERGADLRARWRDYFLRMCDLLGASDPDRRVDWFGPPMGVRMFTTARQMETWAHGQDVYDLLGRRRTHTDRLRNIAVIGVRTYGWTFANRGLEPPGPAPHVRLTAPSGDTWTFNAPDEANLVAGDAVEFCHVVTQGRNVADCHLTVVGEPARAWMAIAQCFAGPPEDPPAPGSRTAAFR